MLPIFGGSPHSPDVGVTKDPTGIEAVALKPTAEQSLHAPVYDRENY